MDQLEKELYSMESFDNDVHVSPKARQQYRDLVTTTKTSKLEDILSKTFGGGLEIEDVSDRSLMLPQAATEETPEQKEEKQIA